MSQQPPQTHAAEPRPGPGSPAAGVLPLRRGDNGPAIAQVRAHLSRLGYVPPIPLVDPDQPFDESVERAVLAFQQQRGLACDGVVGRQTWRLLDEARWRLGDRVVRYAPSHLMAGDDIAALQRRLLELGFAPGRIDGMFGPDTEHALRDFQRNVGIPVDGLCGPVTFAALDRLARTVVGGTPDELRETERWVGSGPGLAGKLIVIDPGHGGRDTGSVGHGLVESEVVADLAARIEGRLVAVGVSAYLTRGQLAPDVDPPDETDRARFANRLDADLLLSLHCDSQTTSRAQGVACFHSGAGPSGAWSAVGRTVAEQVQSELVGRTDLLDGRIDGKTWDLLRRTRMPAVRLEVGYLSNAHDAARLAQAAFRDTVAEAVLVALQHVYQPVSADLRDRAPVG